MMDHVKVSKPIPETTIDSPQADDSVWRQALAEMKLQVTRSTFDQWIAGLRWGGCEDEDGELRVCLICPSEYVVEWCSERLAPLIARSLGGVLGSKLERLRIDYRVEEVET